MFTVLLVDDDALVRSYLKQMDFWKDAGFTIAGEAADGKEALEFLTATPADVVITDLSMPVKDGLTLIREAKRLAMPPYVIVLTRHDEFEWVKPAFRGGADEYILKKDLNQQSLWELLNDTRNELMNRAAGDTAAAAVEEHLRSAEQTAGKLSRPVQQAVRFVEAHYAEDIGLAEAARAAGVSSTYLSSRFGKEMGCVFSVWLQQQRIGAACALLTRTDLRIGEIAQRTGFRDAHYFSKVFRQTQGISAVEYRRQNG